LIHNFGSRYARKSIKGSKDADHSVVSKKRRAKKWLIGLAPRDRYSWPKGRENIPPLWRHSHRTPNPKRNFFFSLN